MLPHIYALYMFITGVFSFWDLVCGVCFVYVNHLSGADLGIFELASRVRAECDEYHLIVQGPRQKQAVDGSGSRRLWARAPAN